MKNGKRILKVTLKKMIDESPDTSFLGEYSNRATSEFSIDRKHSLDCPVNSGADGKLLWLGCDCGERGYMGRNEYQYFNPSFNYVDKDGHALKENTPEDAQKYTRQDYERMESLNAGQWCYLGIRAEAQVQLTKDGPLKDLTSNGLWGVESDAGREHTEEIEREEMQELRGQLLALGFSRRAIASAFKNVERKDA